MKKTIFLLMMVGMNLMAMDSAKLPKGISVSCENVKIYLDQKSFWNLRRIYYKGNYAAQANGWYGTVMKYAGLGWVGSGHLENKIGEKIQTLEFRVDGKSIAFSELKSQSNIQCKSFEFEKKSILLNIELIYNIKLENNILFEKTKLTMLKNSTFSIGYNFMHCWNIDFSDYLLVGAKTLTGSFESGKSLTLSKPRYAILYNRNKNYGIVSVVNQAAEKTDPYLYLWNRVPKYRKIYLAGFKRQRFKALEKFDFVMKTSFFSANAENWRQEAEKLAKQLLKCK